MKTNFNNTLFLGFFILSIIGCNEIHEDITNQIDQEVKIKDKLLEAFLNEHGFSLEDVQKVDDGYLIEGDIYVSKQNLLNRQDLSEKSKGENLQAHSTALVSFDPGVVRTFTFRFSPSMPTTGEGLTWRTAVQQAFSEYNSIHNFTFNFVETTDLNADITINGGLSGAIGRADWPSNGFPGENIDFNLNSGLAPGVKKFAAAHEIGHTIGLRHTDWEINDPVDTSSPPVGAHRIAGTWNDDPASVMNSGFYHPILPPWSNFSIWDFLSFRTLYPLDNTLGPMYVYDKFSNETGNWSMDWSELGFGTIANDHRYLGFNGYVSVVSKSGLVPLYKYYSPGSNWHYISTNPNIHTQFPGWNSLGIFAYVNTAPGTDLIPVYEYSHPTRGFHFTPVENSTLCIGTRLVI